MRQSHNIALSVVRPVGTVIKRNMSRRTSNMNASKRKALLEDLKRNKQGGSRLDSFELEEEEDVFDIVDEDEYAQIVEKRRQGNDFVVDDNGIGYRDDGEEVLGVKQDEYDSRKRAVAGTGQGADDDLGDDAAKRKAQRLNRAAALGVGQTNTMFSFVKTGQSTVQRKSTAATQQQEDLDIDKLLESAPRQMVPGAHSAALPRMPMLPRVAHEQQYSYRAPLPSTLEPSRVQDRFNEQTSLKRQTTEYFDEGAESNFASFEDDADVYVPYPEDTYAQPRSFHPARLPLF